jgi:hypothetical protein
MTTKPDSHRYAHATHTVMKLMDKEMRLEDAVWEAVREQSLGLCEYGRLIKEAECHYPKP